MGHGIPWMHLDELKDKTPKIHTYALQRRMVKGPWVRQIEFPEKIKPQLSFY